MAKIYFGIAGNRFEQNGYKRSKIGRQNQRKQKFGFVLSSASRRNKDMPMKPARGAIRSRAKNGSVKCGHHTKIFLQIIT